MQGARTDALPDEPVAFGDFAYPADVALFAPFRNGSEFPVDVLDVLKQFDSITMVYICIICISIHIVAIIIAIMFRSEDSS